MNSSSESSFSHSKDSVIWIIDEPGDNTRRPCDPAMLPFLQAVTEKIKLYEAMKKEREKQNGNPPTE
jgi:hypothetical protein